MKEWGKNERERRKTPKDLNCTAHVQCSSRNTSLVQPLTKTSLLFKLAANTLVTRIFFSWVKLNGIAAVGLFLV